MNAIAYYFGYGDGGHFLRMPNGRSTLDPERDVGNGFPWSIGLLDTGLLKNRRAPEPPDGRVHWTASSNLWHAFFWWDRSGDKRPACNSGFYVHGFPYNCREYAWDFACKAWPDVVARQLHPLVLVEFP